MIQVWTISQSTHFRRGPNYRWHREWWNGWPVNAWRKSRYHLYAKQWNPHYPSFTLQSAPPLSFTNRLVPRHDHWMDSVWGFYDWRWYNIVVLCISVSNEFKRVCYLFNTIRMGFSSLYARSPRRSSRSYRSNQQCTCCYFRIENIWFSLLFVIFFNWDYKIFKM